MAAPGRPAPRRDVGGGRGPQQGPARGSGSRKVEGTGEECDPPADGWGPGPEPPCRPPMAVRGRRQGTREPPPLPPILPLRPKRGQRQAEQTAAPHPPQRGRCTRGGGAPRPRQAPPMNRPHAPAVPAADQRQTGGAQDGAHGVATSETSVGKAGAQTRVRGSLPPSLPPPAAMTHWRPTGPRSAPMAARQPRRHGYTPRGAPETTDGRPTPDRKGGGGVTPPAPPPRSPPGLRDAGALTLRPPRPEETPPLPQEGRRRGGGGAAGPAHRAPQRPLPPAPAGVAADGRARTSAPRRHADQARGRHAAAHQNSMGAVPHMTPP